MKSDDKNFIILARDVKPGLFIGRSCVDCTGFIFVLATRTCTNHDHTVEITILDQRSLENGLLDMSVRTYVYDSDEIFVCVTASRFVIGECG